MVDRPILRFLDPIPAARRTGPPRNAPRPQGPGRHRQGQRFQPVFDALAAAFDADDPAAVLRQDPAGIAPERALVFVTAGPIQYLARAAQAAGLEIFAEIDLDPDPDYPEGFEPPADALALSRTLYATMPTLDAFRRILTLWRAHQNGEQARYGAAPWWAVFDLLLELRPWGPEDRLTPDARAVIQDRLPFDDNEPVHIELEIWPTVNDDKRATWREQTRDRITDADGEILDTSSITAPGFVYEAILAALPARAVRAMLDQPAAERGLATIEGVQFIMPQMLGQALPSDPDGEPAEHELRGEFDAAAPVRAALLDGTPAAAHPAIDGGLYIEDIHNLVPLSPGNRRFHATAMASLILRGDLNSDGTALADGRLVSVPVLVDTDDGAWTPTNRLFVDLLHSALTQLISGTEPLAPEIFVINLSIGVPDVRFGGRISALARLIDWWAERHGNLFVISAGNIPDPLPLTGITSTDFENADPDARHATARDALRAIAFNRTLLAPSEAMNGLTIGALSKDLSGLAPPAQAGLVTLESDAQHMPQITTALGLGPHRCIKPDLLNHGGRQELRTAPHGDDTLLHPVQSSRRTGIVAAAPLPAPHGLQKSRGTSPAAALTTRAILQAAAALTAEDGPYEGQELPPRSLALLTRALAVNAARWPDEAQQLYTAEKTRLGNNRSLQAKEEVCRHFGYGLLAPELMQESPDAGVTLVGLGTIRKDQAQIFRLPLPPSLAGDRVPRSMRVTLAWFTPVNPARAQYRLAGLEAVAAGPDDDQKDTRWRLHLKSDGPEARLINRGSIWSQRLIHGRLTTPDFTNDLEIPITVQCRDAAGGGLNPDHDIDFAIAVTLQVEADVQYDVLNEVQQSIMLPLQQSV